MNTCAPAPVTIDAPRAATQGRLDCGHAVKGEAAVDLHTTDPESTDPRKFCRHDACGTCPGPAHTLLDEHFQPTPQQYTPQGRLNPDTLNEHVARCDLCLRRLLGCARVRGCDNALAALDGAALVIVDDSARKLFDRSYVWAEAREPAQVELLVTLWRSRSLDPDQLPKIDNLPGYLHRSARNKMVTWLEREERQLGLWKGGPVAARNVPLDGHENPSEDPLIRLHMPDMSDDPEALGAAYAEVTKLRQLLANYADQLEQGKRGTDRRALLRYWIDNLQPGSTFNQSEASRALRATGIQISQPTVYRWVLDFKLDLFEVLNDPDNGLSPYWREKAIKLFCSPPSQPREDTDTRPMTGDEASPNDPALDIDSETGSDHD